MIETNEQIGKFADFCRLLQVSKKTARTWIYFLRERYGERFGVPRLLRCAVAEAVKAQAKQSLEAAFAELEEAMEDES